MELLQKKLETFSDPTILLSVTSPSPKEVYKQEGKEHMGLEQASTEKFIGEFEHMEIGADVKEKTLLLNMPYMRSFDSCRIHLGDSRKVIKQIPDQSIDLILTDPPYNLSPYSTGNIKLSWRKEFNNDLAEWDKEDFNPKDWAKEFVRVLKPNGNLFAFTSYNLLGRWHETFDPLFDTFQFMVWHKTNPAPKIRRAGFLNSCELIVCAWNKGHTWNFGKQSEMHNFIESSICMGSERTKNPVHPTQKPIKILGHIIKMATNPKDMVFDPFMGVGSIGVAALGLNRQFIGVEIDKQYFDCAEQRLKNIQRML